MTIRRLPCTDNTSIFGKWNVGLGWETGAFCCVVGWLFQCDYGSLAVGLDALRRLAICERGPRR